MGSRLKGKKPSKKAKDDRRALMRVIMYGVIGLGVIILLWALWLSERGLKVAKDMKKDAPVGRQTPGI